MLSKVITPLIILPSFGPLPAINIYIGQNIGSTYVLPYTKMHNDTL